MAQRPYQEAFDPSVEYFQDRDDYKRKTNNEAPEWNPNSPRTNFRLSASKLASLNPGKRTVILEPIASVDVNDQYNHDALGVVAIDSSEPVLRDALREPNFLPRIPLVNYGPFGSMTIQPLLKVFGPGQKLVVGGGSLGGNIVRFEDGTAPDPSTETIPQAGGGFTESDRITLKDVRALALGISSRLAALETKTPSFSSPVPKP